MKKIWIVLIAVIFLILIGCAKSEEPAQPQEQPPANEPAPQPEPEMKELTLLTTRSKARTEEIIKQFEEKSGIKIRVKFEMPKDIMANKDKPIDADVVWTSDLEFINRLQKENHVITIVSKSPWGMMANTDKVKNLNSAINEYAHGTMWANQVAFPDVRHSNGLVWATNLYGIDPKTEHFFEDLNNIGLSLYHEEWGVANKVSKGEQTIGVGNVSDALHHAALGDPITVAPITGKYGKTLMVDNAVIKITNAENQEEAEEFVRFLTSAEMEKILTDQYFEIPLTEGVAVNEKLKPFIDSPQFTFNYDELKPKMDEVSRELTKMFGGELTAELPYDIGKFRDIKNPTYDADVEPIIATRCLTCHAVENGMRPELDFSKPDKVKAQAESGTLAKAIGPDGQMRTFSKISEEEVDVILRWIDQGMK
ncbi:substrate-binding domain-containing protein [Microaerobacter geothermalis]|nr:substrate-binding domain-containing protein [Microaerobacter geothermalis]